MNELKQQIRELLSQDIMLEMDFKQKVLERLEDLEEAKLQSILSTLQAVVNEENEVLSQVVKDRPYFFIELQHKILEVMEKDFAKREEVDHIAAENNLKTDLQKL